MSGLFIKLTGSFVAIALVAVGIIALLTNRATTSEFGAYLQHTYQGQGMMGGMMGARGMMEMMGIQERSFLQAVNNSLWFAGLAAVTIAIVLSLALSRQLTSPLRRLTRAAKLIAAGELSQQVDTLSKDEIGELASAFNAMAQSLKRKDELRRQFMADVAHELRTPLSVIQGNLEAMLDGVVPVDAEQIASLHHESLLLSRLVTDLRDLSLAEAGQLKLQPSAIDLRELAREVVANFQPQAHERRVSLTTTLPPKPFRVIADPDRLRQVLGNLLTNALRHTPEQGSIVVGLEEAQEARGQWLTVSVSDTGGGIPADDLPHIFEHFYRARDRHQGSGGTGVGLAVVKRLVEAHGGRVWAESQPGQGSTFYFTMPLEPANLEPASRGKLENNPYAGLSSRATH